MNIDWFTFAAQIVNFLILVALLRWLLYGPIVRAMRERERRIADRLEEADRKRAEAGETIDEYEQKCDRLDQQRDELLAESRKQAGQERERLLKEAKREVERRRERWREALGDEREALLADLRRQAGETGLHVARRTLAELADAELERRMCDTLASRLGQMGNDRREEIRNQLRDGSVEATVHSAFDLPDDQRERIGDSIREAFRADAEISFERSADLICGLELDVGGYSFGWNIRDFLGDLEVRFSERLKDDR